MGFERAIVHQGGRIQFVDYKDKTYYDAVELGFKVGKKIRAQIEVQARLAYDNETLLVPGVPEAANNDMALKEIGYFIEIIKWRMLPRKSLARLKYPRRDFESCTDPNTFFKYEKLNNQKVKKNA